MVAVDKDSLNAAYESVRDDKSEETCCLDSKTSITDVRILRHEELSLALSKVNDMFHELIKLSAPKSKQPATFGYDDSNQVVHVKSGVNYDEFLEELKDDERLYGFIRIESGDEMSKRAKFVLVAWVGENVSPMKKAKVGTDKSFVKAVLKNFAVEILTGERSELQLDQVKQLVQKAGGANYGTGQ